MAFSVKRWNVVDRPESKRSARLSNSCLMQLMKASWRGWAYIEPELSTRKWTWVDMVDSFGFVLVWTRVKVVIYSRKN
jgi:hypothetical protein